MIYLDNAATTTPMFFRADYEEYWKNANTGYAYKESKLLTKATEKIKNCLHVKGGHVLFFRGASEAIEWLAHKFCTEEVYCSPYEHDSVYEVSDYILDNERVQKTFDMQEYALYCHQLVNPITGDIWDIKKIIEDKHIIKSSQFVGVDITAAIGHMNLPTDLEDYCDALWFSGHKFYTEKNIGAMWISDKLYEFTGDKVHGTPDIQGILMLADAMDYVCRNFRVTPLIIDLTNELSNLHINYNILWKAENKLSTYVCALSTYIYAINLPSVNADALQSYLATKDIYIGTAHSACSAHDDFRVLEAMGYNKETARQTIRVSFSIDNTIDDVVQLAREIQNFKEMF